ncbi:MAG: alpha-galactosidase [Clostridia bacterium]|nr:alpha-galactosidase [Clostridia bacterium]
MAVFYNEETKTFYLEGKGISYVFGINETNFPEHYYFGTRIGRDDLRYTTEHNIGDSAEAALPGQVHAGGKSYNLYRSEFSVYGNGELRECSFAMLFGNGSRINDFNYETHEILPEKPAISGMPSMRGGETLKLTLKDKNSEMRVHLFYTVYDDAAVVARRMEAENRTAESVKILRAYSFALDVYGNDHDLLTLENAWARENRPERTHLPHGTLMIDEKSGSSTRHHAPAFALLDKDTTEDRGNALGVSLIYSSSFALKAQVSTKGYTRLTGGINDFDFCWVLGAGETFATPEAVLAFSDEGIGGMSRELHDAYRNHLINPRYVKKPRPIVINSWEAVYFDPSPTRLMPIIDAVKGTGIDTFVLDDGWFGARRNDRAGLGDWVVSKDVYPEGLKPVIDHAHNAGMKFGIWFEPEMVNPDSDLFRAHPDWAISVPGVEPCVARRQLVLDITRADVRDYIVEAVSKILRENEIDYVKWDFNRALTENFSRALPAEREQELHHRYALGFYDICERLVNGFPHIFFEGCAGGGGRFDPAVLYYFPQIWASDDTDAYMRTQIQHGTSIFYPLSAISCHTSICPNHQTNRTLPFKTRADIAHLGATGYELDTTKITPEEIGEVKTQVADYKEMQDLVLEGDLYRLENTFESNYFAQMIVSKDKSRAHITVMRALCRPNDEHKRIYPRGLAKNAIYEVINEEYGLKMRLSGATIMNVGLVINLKTADGRMPGDFKTFIFKLKKFA